jgi:uncharacterized protein (TIGR02145 family)
MKKLVTGIAFLSFLVTGSAQQSKVIGSQNWMTRNLDVAFYRNGDPIPQVTDSTVWANLTTGAWCYYKNDIALGATYGKLYNWYAVNDPRGLAPAGWHIPSDAEWNTLEYALGGAAALAGGKMKEAGTLHWSSPNNAGDNSSGWAALPGGNRFYNGSFENILQYGMWWTSSEDNTANAWYHNLSYKYGFNFRYSGNKRDGYSVRCIR